MKRKNTLLIIAMNLISQLMQLTKLDMTFKLIVKVILSEMIIIQWLLPWKQFPIHQETSQDHHHLIILLIILTYMAILMPNNNNHCPHINNNQFINNQQPLLFNQAKQATYICHNNKCKKSHISFQTINNHNKPFNKFQLTIT